MGCAVGKGRSLAETESRCRKDWGVPGRICEGPEVSLGNNGYRRQRAGQRRVRIRGDQEREGVGVACAVGTDQRCAGG